MSKLIPYRQWIQLFFGFVTVTAIFTFNISLWIIFGLASLLGILMGKTFCKWICPMGFIMELMTRGMSEDQSAQHMYNYYKIGCPISWAQGFFNKYSLFKIKTTKSSCTSCGLCDQTCYITKLDKSYSFYKSQKNTPSEAFNCSKCLKCVEVCPTNSIEIKSDFSLFDR